MINLLVRTASDADTVQIAAAELKYFIGKLRNVEQRIDVTIELSAEADDSPQDSYNIDIDFRQGGGKITGSNNRSVIFGVYKFLEMLGFRWVRPGALGEYIPESINFEQAYNLSSCAGYSHRGECIEGALSLQNVLDKIEWMMRLGFNTFYIQFRNAYTFFDRWYSHEENPLLTPEPFDNQRAQAITTAIRQELHRRGMDLHTVGHGWTCEPLGIPGPGWTQHQGEIPPEVQSCLAEVNGKRELWGGIALNTNLCYGKAEVREKITDDIVKYAQENLDVNTIHFWLADGYNNQCECPLCTVQRPADWYIELLNLADEKLTAARLPVKLVFLIYVDLLWPPEKNRLRNPDRFILMFAPITRSYTTPFTPGNDVDKIELPPFDRNHLTMPESPDLNMAFLRAWQKHCPASSSFDFDYHFMWDHHKDPGFYRSAQILHQDCRNLKAMQLDGLISCQSQRVCFPHGLGSTVMAKTLWDPAVEFEEIADDYFAHAYGDNWQAAQDYFRQCSEIFHPPLIRNEGSDADKLAAVSDVQKYHSLAEKIAPAIENGLLQSSPCQRESWAQLQLHTQLSHLLTDFLSAAWSGKDHLPAVQKLFAWVRKHEMRLQSVLDVYEYIYTIKTAFKLPKEL
ncbi:MAG: DUF4838 domain-containing protein [Lentisphaerae bacterium]|nr:DUF4838 domain-containing protein [Lentisphaerota bacterium]